MALQELLAINDQTEVNLPLGVLKSFARNVISASINTMQAKAVLGENEALLTRNEVAEMLRVNLRTLERWHNNKYLVHFKAGGRCRYRLSDVLKIVNN